MFALLRLPRVAPQPRQLPRLSALRWYTSRATTPEITDNDRQLHIKWSDSWVSRFHYVWLRDNCQCQQCLHSTTRQKLHSSAHVPIHIRPESVSWSRDGKDEQKLRIVWQSDPNGVSSAFRQQHVSEFRHGWLQGNCYSSPRLAERLLKYHQHVLWDREMAKSTDLWVDYDALMVPPEQNEKEPELFKLLNLLQSHGLAFIRGVPVVDKQVEQVALRIGPIRETFYGRSWDVKSVPNARNIAYTSLFLGLHMDLMYFESPPGLQFLHCLEASVQGGESIFLDSYRAIARFQQAHPAEFQTLVHTPVTFHYRNSGHKLRFRRPMIEVDDDNQPLQVYYAPPFQGPLEVDAGRVDAFYDAFSKLDKFMEARDHVYEYRLRPGDCVVFANRRVLHGRLAFNSASGMRHLKGTYVDWDAMRDRLSVLRDKQSQ